ncbi:MAG: NAD(P)H-hydrate dehydratase [Actinobacteria bacterium]|nr:MAG: NAD(P)H-hydrate dehydratase [Actinomycetota bacterium]
MQYALGADGMRSAEKAAVDSGEATLAGLMARAGAMLADEVERSVPAGAIAVVTGKGNNGGDGWVAARVLAASGREVRVLALAVPDALAGEAAAAAQAALEAGVRWEPAGDALAMAEQLDGVAVIVDAVFGVGFSGAAREPYASAIVAMDDADAPVISADVPSGVDAGTGAVAGPAVHAAVTVTFSAPKPGLLLYPGAGCAGEIVVADIGLQRDVLDSAGGLEVWDRGDYRATLPVPSPDAHKGQRGSVLLVAGSRLYAGSAVLAAAGAMRMGAGYVFAAVPASVAPVMQAALPHVIAVGLKETAEGTLAASSVERIIRLAAEVDAVVLGPGLTTHAEAVSVVRRLVELLPSPLVLDADGLNAFAETGPGPIMARSAPTVITPHPGELARLLGVSTPEVQADRVSAAGRVAGCRLACVLKGARTIVSAGGRTVVTLAGNPGMATAGSGDVLAGMIGTLLAQGLDSLEAGALGAFVHSRAGDLAAEELTEICLTAKDLPAYVPAAVREILG